MFSITAKICTLKYNNENEDNILLFRNKKYIVPIYQRPYEWSFEQVEGFISDLFKSFWGITKLDPPEQIFYGTMLLSKENEYHEQEIIDGQQRMSTLLLLLFVLKNIFPDAKDLSDIDFTWLSTKVNCGKQQEYLDKILAPDFKFNATGKNPYQTNAALIKEYIEEQLKEIKEFDHNNFITHLLSNVYFSVIETNAGLSKTIQIFDSINTKGMGLNGADVFKLRMYEYLRDIKNQGEAVFEEIERLYKLIIDNNEKYGDVSDIYEILTIYRYIIISEFELSRDLYASATETFFDQLFDTLLKINIWEHFKKNIEKVDLSLETLEKIINIRYEWENPPYETVEDGCADSLIDLSRYSRYHILKYVFLFYFKGQDNYFHNLMLFIRKLSKLYSIYSIRYNRTIYEIDGFTYDLINEMVSRNYENVMNCIIKKIGKPEVHRNWYDYWYYLEDKLNGDIVYNPKLKNIVCRLSAMLHEDIFSKNKEKIEKVKGNLFRDVYIDIEHIQSYQDENENKRNDIKEKWGDDINSIGNLMVLEYDINRSISNKPYVKKIIGYADSCFKVVHDQINNYHTWDLDDCKKRKEYEVKK
jgi:uncharacterized protein with ParB-like and HNH nuclease domain